MSLQFVRGNMTSVQADAIVIAASKEPEVGLGIQGEVYEAAGYNQLLDERRKLGRLDVGQAGATPAFNVNGKIIIHTVCPRWDNGQSDELDMLYACYLSAFKVAINYNCESIAFPLLGTGVYGVPQDKAIQVAIDVIRRMLDDVDMTVYMVIKSDDLLTIPEYIMSGNETCKQWKDRIGFRYNVPNHNSEKNDYRSLKWKYPSGTVVGSIPIDPKNPPKFPPQFPPQFSAQGAIPSCGSLERPKDKVIHTPLYTPSHRTIEEVLAQEVLTFQQLLLRFIDRSGMTEVEVYKKANIDRKLFSKIRCNEAYKPSKKTIVALAIALELDIKETEGLLARAEIAFSPCNTFDKVVRYYIENKIYDIYTINLMLFKLELPMLGE